LINCLQLLVFDLLTDVTQIEKNDWSASVLACIERRFDAKKRSRDIEVEFYRNAFSRSALIASGTLALQSDARIY